MPFRVLILSLLSISAQADDLFSSQVLPILKDNCYECHSHEANKMKGGLTLDSRSGWANGGDSGPTIIPGKPEKSLLITAIRHEDSDYEMPPKKKLSDDEIAIITNWIKRGAPDPRDTQAKKIDTNWWSLRPLNAVKPPISGHPIDAFIEEKLTQNNLNFAPPANRTALARRLFVDLHGCLPTPEEISTYVEDQNPQATKQLVNHLLASPRYGERWARHWLDTIHFADSHGCEHDEKRRHAWRFRDYVIERLNADVSWDNFIREQLAPDVFYPDEPQLAAGLGFIAAGPLELSRAGTAKHTFDYLDRDDIVTQTMAAFASTTANCARCHNHKFDPVSQEDYFALQAVFSGVGKGDIEFEPSQKLKTKRHHLQSLLSAATNKDYSQLTQDRYQPLIQSWITTHRKNNAFWHPLTLETFSSSGGASLTPQDDGSLLAHGHLPDQENYTLTTSLPLKKITALRLDVLEDDRHPKGGPGRAENGNFHLSEVSLKWFPPNAGTPVSLKISRASADFDQEGWTSAQAIDGNLESGWAIYPKVDQSHHIVLELEEDFDVIPGGKLAITLKQLHPPKHIIGRFKLSATDAKDATAQPFSSDVINGLVKTADERTKNEQLAISAIALKEYAQEALSKLPPKHTVYGVSNFWSHAKKLAAYPPKPVHLLRRGDINKPQQEVGPGALSSLRHLPGRFALDDPNHEPARRAALADWIAHPENPLTWRSIVNRVWHYHFGKGLTNTPNDLGRMGTIPSHPELLDWLAIWFRDQAKGSLKALHKLILTSKTWQQSSLNSAHKVDSTNQLLSHMRRQRLDAGAFRDSLLHLSGKLEFTMGGPGIEQFVKSAGHQGSKKLDYENFDWNSAHAARRSIYRVVWRGIPDPFMEALDFPDLGLLTPKRTSSVSSLQSLALFNNNFVLHSSQWLSDRAKKERQDLKSQIHRLIELLWLRPPNVKEQTLFKTYAQQHGLSALCRILINSNEFLFIE